MWTSEQRMVIENRDSNLLVAAAAGSGKTAVMIERIIQRILDMDHPVDIDKLLVLTFTNAAASEMKDRIRSALEREISKEPDNANLQRQMALLNMANICTIDSFCKNVLTKNIHVTDLDYNVKIGDATEMDLLAYEVLEDLFDKLYDEDNEDFLKLVEYYSNRAQDKDLAEMIFTLNKFVDSSPYPNKWLDYSAEFFNVDTKDDWFYVKNYLYPVVMDAKILLEPIYHAVLADIDEVCEYEVLKKLEYNLEVVRSSSKSVLDSIKEFLCLVEDEKEASIESILSCWNDIYESIDKFNAIKYNATRSSKKWDPLELDIYNSVKANFDNYKEALPEIFSSLYFRVDSLKIENMEIYPYLRSLSNLCILFREGFSEKKKSLGVIDFAGLEHYVLDILTDEVEGEIVPSSIAMVYRDIFEEVYTDEYQDSNLVQEIILSMVSKSNNRFMVGDVKQSIYRFRQAMPEIFMQKYNDYTMCETKVDGEDSLNTKNYLDSIDRKILLYKNFRSRAEVLEGCNEIFNHIMTKEVGEIEYSGKEALNPGAVFKELDEEIGVCGGPIEIHLLEDDIKTNASKSSEEASLELSAAMKETGYDQDLDDDECHEGFSDEMMAVYSDLSGFKKEAVHIAKLIKDMIDNNDKPFMVYDKDEGKYRKVSYKDIVILMRSPKSKVGDLEEVFQDYNIPMHSDLGDGYFDTLEVDTMINLLKVIDNPISDIELVAVMRSPIFEFTPMELAKIRLNNKEVNFYEAIHSYRDKGDDDSLKLKLSSFIDKIYEYRKLSYELKMSDFIWFLMKDTGYMSYASMLENGENRKNNLIFLFERAKKFESMSYSGIFNFVNYIERMKQKNANLSEAKMIADDFNMVRLMSIHKSKGLEFPVVIVADCAKGFNFTPDHHKISFHQEMGYGPMLFDKSKKIKYESLYRKIISRKKMYEQISEEMRLLYVAMTRAKEKLIFTSVVKNMDKKMDDWSDDTLIYDGLMERKAVLDAKSYLNWIMPVVLRLNKNDKNYGCTGEKSPVYGYGMCKWQIISRSVSDMVNEYVKDMTVFDENEGIHPSISDYIESDTVMIEPELYVGKDEVLKILDENLNKDYEHILVATKPSRISVTDIKKMKQSALNKAKEIELKNANVDEAVESTKLDNTNVDKGLEFVELDNANVNEGIESINVDNSNSSEEYSLESPTSMQYIPSFMHGDDVKQGYTPAEKGSIFHLVLQVMDFSIFNGDDSDDMVMSKIESTLNSMVENKIIEKNAVDVVNKKWIFNYIKNPLFKDIQDAMKRNKLYKEKAINYLIDLNEVYPEVDKGVEKTMVVGIIDLFYEKEDKSLVLIDYKTDYVPSMNTDIIVERYNVQLEVYKKAMEEISGKVVSEVYLYLFSIGRYVKVEV